MIDFLGSTYLFYRHFDTGEEMKLSTKICVEGSQRNHLNETFQMHTENEC